MGRDSLQYRIDMRSKHIERKKRITSHYWGAPEYPYYKYDGMYSKGKIHCSCPLCATKTSRKRAKWKIGGGETKNWKHSDLQKLRFLHDQIVDLYAAVVESVDSPA